MRNLNEVLVGQPLSSFPGGTFNELVRSEIRRRQDQATIPATTAPPAHTEAPAAYVLLLWSEADPLPPGSLVVVGEVLQSPENDASVPYAGLQFHCRAPEEEDDLTKVPFAITKTPIAQGTIGFGAIPNATWAQVVINSADDEFADLVADQVLLSSSASGRVPIIWKPSGTGQKWCVVALGAGGGAGDLVVGQATTSVSSGTSTFAIDNIRCIEGTDPRTDPESASETLSVKNTLGLALENNQLVYARRNKEGDWDTWADTKGEGGDPGEPGAGALFAEFTATSTSSHTTDTVTGDIDHSWGGTPGSTTGVTVHKLSDHDVTIYSGDKFIGVWDTEDDKWKLLYYDGMRVAIKGTIAGETDVTPSTTTFTLSSIALVNGWRLPGSVTVTNDPPIYAAAGAAVYARFNLTLGSNPLTSWDTGDGGNFLPKLKGIGGYNEGGDIQFVANEEGNDDPDWISPDSYDGDEIQQLGHNTSGELLWVSSGISMAWGQATELVNGDADFEASSWDATGGPESPASPQTIQNPLGFSIANGGDVFVAKIGSNWYCINAECP